MSLCIYYSYKWLWRICHNDIMIWTGFSKNLRVFCEGNPSLNGGLSSLKLCLFFYKPEQTLNKQSNCWWFEKPWHSSSVTVIFSEMGLFRADMSALYQKMWFGLQAVHPCHIWFPGWSAGWDDQGSAEQSCPSDTARTPTDVWGHWGCAEGRH